MGGRMGRYTGSPDTLVFDQRIDLRAFLLAALQAWVSCIYYGRSPMWWRMVSLGQLPVLRNWSSLLLLITPFTCCTMRRINYACGSLGNINWTSSTSGIHMFPLRALLIKSNFGAKEHNYSHWLSLNHTAGWWDLAKFLFVHPEAASSAKRDATPLRLLSWLSFRLEPAVDKLVEATMLHLSTVDEVKDSDVLALGTTHLAMDTPFVSAEALRDHLIELISVRIARRLCLLCSANSCRGSLCLGYVTSWTLCYHNWPQSVLPGRMLLGRYGLATIFVPPRMRTDIRMSQGLPLLTSLRHMITFTMWGFSGAPLRSSCFRIHEWFIRCKARLYIDCINSISN